VIRETPNVATGRSAQRDARDRRLAEALRANLRRRKEQARARADDAAMSADEPAADEPRG
jgi:hypothetical protein